MTWLVIPASDRALARRVVQRIDEVLGYPRALSEADVSRIGTVSRTAPIAGLTTESQAIVMLHVSDAGTTALRGAVAIGVDPVVNALRDRVVDIDGVRRRIRDWIAAQGWQVFGSLPGAIDRWSQVVPRDGATGSPDGVPIPAKDDPEPDAP